MRFGRPNVRGVAVETITEMYAAGEGIDRICDDYEITRADLLVAHWYAGLYGTRAEKRWLKAWATAAGSPMWHGQWDDVEDPPEKPKRRRHPEPADVSQHLHPDIPDGAVRGHVVDVELP